MSDHQNPTSDNLPISVVIPLYNKAEDVRRAILSALAQTHPAHEIVVVDDGSTDGSAEIVRAIAHPRVRLIAQANQGVSVARNRGIASATSELIAFLDADDEWKPAHLETLARLAARFPHCQVFATSYVFRVSASGAERAAILRGLPRDQSEFELVNYFDVAAQSDPPLCSSAMAATKAALNAVGGFPPGIAEGEDLLTWARLAMRYRIALSRKTTATFWQPAFDTAAATRRPEPIDRVGAELSALAELADDEHRRAVTRYLGLWHKMRGTMYLRLGERGAAREELRRASRLSGFSMPLLAYRVIAALPGRFSTLSSGATPWLRRVHRLTSARA